MNAKISGEDFENEVRKIARALWLKNPGDGGSRIIDGRERDCIYDDEYVTHYIEITTDRKLDKVRSDVKKMTEYREKQSRRNKAVMLWFITLEEPTADQRECCRTNGVEILSFIEFGRKIIDASQYLALREKYQFGSVTDPGNGGTEIVDDHYQPICITDTRSNAGLVVNDLANLLEQKKTILLLGDYGMGKSINVKQVFIELRKRYYTKDGVNTIPVVLNLREHWGQVSPTEALSRHAENIGFSEPYKLIRAYNAGRITVILDGFDEIGSVPWSRAKDQKLKIIRRNAVRLINSFVSQSRARNGVLIAGREYFFDSRTEMLEAMGLSSDCTILSINEFTDDEVQQFLNRLGYRDSIPDWFPRRPLLLASLAAKGLLATVMSTAGDTEEADAWDHWVDLICERESKIHENLDSSSIRSLLESLATRTRRAVNNIGPILEDDVAEAFRKIAGVYPDEKDRILLQRLPGMSMYVPENGTRAFVDEKMLDTLRASAVLQFILDPWSDPEAREWMNGLGALGAKIVSRRISNRDFATIVVAAREAMVRWKSGTLSMDVLISGQYYLGDESLANYQGISVTDAYCEQLDLDNLPLLENVTVRDSVIGELLLPSENTNGPRMSGCIIKKVVGVSSPAGLPSWLEDSEIGEYDEIYTSAKIISDNSMPMSVRILLVVLKKLYRQRGSGRKENAFYRGMPPGSGSIVDDVLGIVAAEKLAYLAKRGGQKVWHPVSGQRARAEKILSRQGRTDDSVVRAVKEII
ncbi:MAG: NACHT domain-containing protein [Bacteroidetes bacterium]|nr:NACHT domain-containing protein [Bacteroidota bacterium]